jgi:hypothetical protein
MNEENKNKINEDIRKLEMDITHLEYVKAYNERNGIVSEDNSQTIEWFKELLEYKKQSLNDFKEYEYEKVYNNFSCVETEAKKGWELVGADGIDHAYMFRRLKKQE